MGPEGEGLKKECREGTDKALSHSGSAVDASWLDDSASTSESSSWAPSTTVELGLRHTISWEAVVSGSSCG